MLDLDIAPDVDGRYRINEFFCYNDTWKSTLQSLLPTSDCILMDLRGFSRENRGCIYELQQLVQVISLNRVTFLTDSTTDTELLQQTLQHAASYVDASSTDGLYMQIYDMSGSSAPDLKAILKLSAIAATQKSAS